MVLNILVVSLLAAEQDPLMVPPPNAITGKLSSVPPTSAHDAAKTFRVLDGFRMDLLAAEPMVASPVAMAYDILNAPTNPAGTTRTISYSPASLCAHHNFLFWP